MPDDETERPSLEAPQLFGRRRSARKPAAPAPAPAPADDDTAVFDDTGRDVPVPTVPVPDDAHDGAAVPVGHRRGRRTGSPAAPDEPDPTPPARGRLTVPALPTLAPPVAAAVCGALAGLSLVVFVWLGFRGCEAVRGTSSCGTAPGMLALTVIFALAVVVGAVLLRAFHLPEPGACSFLGIGVMAVIALVVLIDALDHWSMVLVVPAISAVTFVGSWWLTTTYVDPSAD
ncbi:hypothetical protein ABFT23_00820 [Nocardioides sp. C4-1]|uniref:hypothetical protein n=1 Tax=Nocardioides sp. C4-1 TaxID=3151851 RepID=UPI003263BF63